MVFLSVKVYTYFLRRAFSFRVLQSCFGETKDVHYHITGNGQYCKLWTIGTLCVFFIVDFQYHTEGFNDKNQNVLYDRASKIKNVIGMFKLLGFPLSNDSVKLMFLYSLDF